DAHLEQVIEAAADHVALLYLRHADGGFPEALERVRVGSVEGHFYEREQAQAQQLRVELRYITFDVAAFFEAADALQARRRAQVHTAGELDVRDAPVPLQDFQDLPVDHVQHKSS